MVLHASGPCRFCGASAEQVRRDAHLRRERLNPPLTLRTLPPSPSTHDPAREHA
jgi:hypothetical protein